MLALLLIPAASAGISPKDPSLGLPTETSAGLRICVINNDTGCVTVFPGGLCYFSIQDGVVYSRERGAVCVDYLSNGLRVCLVDGSGCVGAIYGDCPVYTWTGSIAPLAVGIGVCFREGGAICDQVNAVCFRVLEPYEDGLCALWVAHRAPVVGVDDKHVACLEMDIVNDLMREVYKLLAAPPNQRA